MDLAKRIKGARDTAGLTQATAAARLHISSASLAAYEQGTREVLRAAAIGEVERRLREAALALTNAAASLLSAIEVPSSTLPDRRAESVASGNVAGRVRAELVAEAAPRQKKKRA